MSPRKPPQRLGLGRALAERVARQTIDEEADGRKAKAALYVMLEEDQKKRYEDLAKDLGMSMRDLVTMALDNVAAERNAAMHGLAGDGTYRVPRVRGMVAADGEQLPDVPNVEPGGVDVPWMMRTVLRLNERVARVEEDLRKVAGTLARPDGIYDNVDKIVRRVDELDDDLRNLAHNSNYRPAPRNKLNG